MLHSPDLICGNDLSYLHECFDDHCGYGYYDQFQSYNIRSSYNLFCCSHKLGSVSSFRAATVFPVFLFDLYLF